MMSWQTNSTKEQSLTLRSLVDGSYAETQNRRSRWASVDASREGKAGKTAAGIASSVVAESLFPIIGPSTSIQTPFLLSAQSVGVIGMGSY